MVIRGNSRGNARQLSHYLLREAGNDDIRILDIDGQANPSVKELHEAIFAMGVSAELTKSDKGLYHTQINPAIGEDKLMTDEHWLQAADILGKQLGLEQQRRAIVLHTKKGRTHAHVVWERYDYEKGKMVSDSFSRLAQDRARKEMEASFGHDQTPHRNKHRPELKTALTDLWQNTKTGAEFIKASTKNGYLIGEGVGRTPFIVVDENARSHNLARQLKGVRLKEIRERLRHEELPTEKEAIERVRRNANDDGGTDTDGKEDARFKKAASGFKLSKDNMLQPAAPKADQQETNKQKAKSFKESGSDILAQPDKHKKVKRDFDDNKQQQTDKDKQAQREAFRKRMAQQKDKSQDQGMEFD